MIPLLDIYPIRWLRSFREEQTIKNICPLLATKSEIFGMVKYPGSVN